MDDRLKDKGLRLRMVEQLREKGITDERVLEAMNKVPRHYFVDVTFASEAYLDKALPIDSQQTISSPFTVAYQTQLLQLKPRMKVLEIGTGSGYQAAVLAAMGVKVFTVERDPRLHQVARQRLEDIEWFEFKVKCHLGDGSLGWPLFQPFERILLTAASPGVPLPLQQQLDDKGVLVAPIGSLEKQVMTRMTRVGKDEFQMEKLLPFQFVPLKGRYGFGE